MKKSNFNSLAISALVVCSVNAQTIDVTDTWQLKGATENITSMDGFNNKCVDSVWTYDSANEKWNLHVANGESYNIPTTVSTLSSISSSEGFWIKGNSNCSVDTATTTESTTSFISGKTIVLYPNDEVTMVFSENGDYSESGDDVNDKGEPYSYSCTGKWAQVADNTIAFNCDGSTVLPTASDDNVVFASEILSDGMSVTVNYYDNGDQTENTTVVDFY